MKSIGILVTATTVICAFAGTTFLLVGDWNFEIDAVLAGESVPCVLAGSAHISNGSGLTGTASVKRVSGPPSCPTEMSAALMGFSLVGSSITYRVDGGSDGIATASGSMAGDGQSARGSFDVSGGNFDGLRGNWGATAPVLAVPLLSTAGWLAVATLLIWSAHWILGRR